MLMTFLLTLLMIADIAVVILVGVGCLPAKIVMRTMPKELQEATTNYPNPPLWKMLIGFTVYAAGILLALWISFYAGYEGMQNGWGFGQIFTRYMIILYGFKAFDIICLDWWLITKTHFFQHFFPETEGSKGYENFGFNKKEQLAQIMAFPFVCAAISLLWVWLA